MEQLLEREERKLQPDGPRRGSGRFKKGFIMYLAALAVLILAALAALWVALARYQAGVDAEEAAREAAAALAAEQARDRAALQEALLRFAADSGAETWTDHYMRTPRLETREGVEAAISRLLAQTQAQCYKSEGWSPEQPVYSIYRGERPFARVSMEKRDGSWQPAQVELLLSGGEGGSITVPEGTTVRCGDVVLDADTYAGSPEILCPGGPDPDTLQNPIYGRTYTVSGLLAPPEFVLEQAPAHTVRFGAGCALALTPEQAKPYQDRADALVQALIYYYLRGKDNCMHNMEQAAGLTVRGSQAYETISGSYDGVIWMQSFYVNYRCETVPGDVLIWADNCYSVDVACQAYGSTGQNDKTMDGAYRVFFTDTGEGFGITGLETL